MQKSTTTYDNKKKIRSIERVYDFYFMITLIANIIKRLDFNVIPELYYFQA